MGRERERERERERGMEGLKLERTGREGQRKGAKGRRRDGADEYN
jgi:hypothetical protein